MKKQRIYVDTSVIGGCFDEEFERWSNGLLIDFKKQIFTPVLSEVIEAEIADSPEFVVSKYKEFFDCNAEFLEVKDDALTLTQVYIRKKVLQNKYYRDMLHIALASVNNIDVLVSWNFKHIVRFDKIRLFNAINIEEGYKQLEIYSPMEITFHGKSKN